MREVIRVRDTDAPLSADAALPPDAPLSADAHLPPDAPLPTRANDVYRARNVLGRETLYMNWGLWEASSPTGRPAIRDLDEAARTLVLQIGRLARINPEVRLLDVGFGFGDQLLDWCRHSGLRHGEGINICPEQTEIARRRLASAGLADRVRVQVADAVTLPFEAGSFDAVTAIECAFHFQTRERFFHEARRVLRPQGRLVLADFIGTDHPGRRQRLAQRMASKYWGFAPGASVPRRNTAQRSRRLALRTSLLSR